MTVTETLERLAALGDTKVRARNRKLGAGEAQYGVRLGDIRKLAKEIGTDHDAALALWDTGILEARLSAILAMRPKGLSHTELDALVRSARVAQLADWLNAYVVKKHPDRESLRRAWMDDEQRLGRHRDPPRPAPRPCRRDRRNAGRVPRRSSVQGVHLAVRAGVDRRGGAAAGLRAGQGHLVPCAGVAGNNRPRTGSR